MLSQVDIFLRYGGLRGLAGRNTFVELQREESITSHARLQRQYSLPEYPSRRRSDLWFLVGESSPKSTLGSPAQPRRMPARCQIVRHGRSRTKGTTHSFAFQVPVARRHEFGLQNPAEDDVTEIIHAATEHYSLRTQASGTYLRNNCVHDGAD